MLIFIRLPLCIIYMVFSNLTYFKQSHLLQIGNYYHIILFLQQKLLNINYVIFSHMIFYKITYIIYNMHIILLFYMICIITVHNEVIIISIKRNIKVVILSKKLILKANILILSIYVIFLFAQKLLKILFLI